VGNVMPGRLGAPVVGGRPASLRTDRIPGGRPATASGATTGPAALLLVRRHRQQ
jgi:hypothetical protein